MAAAILTAALLSATEGLLRAMGWGYPTSFFVPATIGNERVLVANDQFGKRFFPPGAARSPSPVVMKEAKPEGTIRLFVFGESAALGDPRPAYGASRYLEVLLEDRFPQGRFEVVCVAMTAVNSHAILPIARECARYRGDIWLFYMGNNEMAGPFGANTVFGPQAPAAAWVRAGLALQTMRTGQWLTSLAQRWRGGSGTPANWGGLRMFMESQLPPRDPRRERVYRNFEKNLEDTLRVAARAGATTLLSTVACNLKDCAPFASLPGSTVPQARQAEWEALRGRGAAAEANGNHGEGLKLFEEAARIEGRFAESVFQQARCQQGLSNLTEARRLFSLARDDDALPFRADSRLNAIIRQAADRHAAGLLHLVDAETELARLTPGGIPGQEFFHEHVHLNFDGNYLLARVWADHVAAVLPEAARTNSKPAWATQEACERRLGLTDWNRVAVFDSMLSRLHEAPFTNQLNHAARLRFCRERIAAIRNRLHPSGYSEARGLYEDAIGQRPRDHRLHENYAEFLEAMGDPDQALIEWRKVKELLPFHYIPTYQVGRMLNRQRKPAEAQAILAEALAMRPDLAEAHIEMGQALAALGKPAEALEQFYSAQKLRPEDARVLIHIAHLLASQGKRPEAVTKLREAVRLRPDHWEARYLLGVELAVQEKVPEALSEFAEVIRLRPDYSLAHLNLGVALAKQGKLDQASAEFRETLRLDPQNRAAQTHLQTIKALQAREQPKPAPRQE